MSRRHQHKAIAAPDAPNATESQPEGITGKFYTVGKTSHLLYEAYEVTIENGVVVNVRSLSRAPDMPQVAVGACTHELQVNLRTQEALDCD